MNGQDYIEVGQGVDSKVIGKDNSISEYFAVILSIGTVIVQGWFIAFCVVFLIVGFYWLEWVYAAIVSFMITTLTPIFLTIATIRLFRTLKSIQEPKEQPRDSKGRFARKATFYHNTKHVGDFYTTENGDTEYVERWGGGG